MWQAVDVLGLGAWLTRETLAARSDGRLPAFALLGQEQAQALWATVIAGESGEDGGPALELRPAQAEALARLMAEAEEIVFAHGLGAAWQAPLPLSYEQSLARRWQRAFRDRCTTLGVGTRTMLLEACASRSLVLAQPGVCSRGFEAAGPVLRSLLPPDAAADVTGGRPIYQRHASLDDECDAALDWARAARAAGVDGGVAIVTVDARGIDALLARATRWRIADGGPAGAAAELSAPLARLATSPLVEHAMLALESLRRLAPMEAVALLGSPYVAGSRAEFGARARLAARVQSERATPLTLADLQALAESGGCAGLLAVLNALKPLAGQGTYKRPMSRWVHFATQWLAAWGWPGSDGLTPQEEAAHAAWQRALDTVAALDLVLPPQTLGDAIARLRQVTRGISTAERVAPDAIEILSLEEAAVLRPAEVWVLGLHDAAWPAVPASNPLLPPALLRRAGVPGSDVAADARRAQQLLSMVAGAARRCVLSHAEHDGDTPRRPSGAIAWPADVLREPPSSAPSLFARWRPPAAPSVLEGAPADPLLPLAPAALAAQRGGVGILAAQAACAFQAFAKYRLVADEVEDAEPGVDPRLRGEIAHAAMAALWRNLRTQANALALSSVERDEAIAAAIETALAETLATRPQHDGRPRALEGRRLQRLVRQCLEQDLAREPFEVIAIEAPHDLTLAQLPLRMRIDRIDRLESGAELILDYKTGKARRKDWESTRPLAPQLLAYALAREPAPLAGIGFSQLRPNDCGLVTEPRSISGDASTLDARRDEWRAALSELARQFVAGLTELNPREGAKTCQRCSFQGLCRVHELQPEAAAPSLDTADES